MHRGYIKLYRKIRENPIWKIKPFSPGQAWEDLLLRANHKDKNVFFHQRLEYCQRGQLITSISGLANDWGWSRTRVRTFLEVLQKEDMSLYKRYDKRYIKIIICNYRQYQDKNENEGQEIVQEIVQEKDKRKTRERQEKDTNKNDKNDKNDKNKKLYIENSVEFSLSKKLWDLIYEKYPTTKKPKIQNWAKEIDKMIRLDKRTPEQIEFIIDWCQKDSFWSMNILSTKTLRKHFDKMIIKASREYKKNSGNWLEKQPGLAASLKEHGHLENRGFAK